MIKWRSLLYAVTYVIMVCMFLFEALEKGEKAGSSEDEDEDETKKKQKEEEGTEGEEEYEEEELEEVRYI